MNDTIKLKRVCSWCGYILSEGIGTDKVTHTVCETCYKNFDVQLTNDEKTKREVNMKPMLILIMVLSFGTIGCNSKLFDRPNHKNENDFKVPQAFTTLAQSPQTTITGEPTNAIVGVRAFYSAAWPWDVTDARNAVPVYTELQPGLLGVYAIWNYMAPTLTVEFINVPAQRAAPEGPLTCYVVADAK